MNRIMTLFSTPKWIDTEMVRYPTLEEIPPEKFAAIRLRLQSVISVTPLVSVVISAWNEELNVVRCLDSLSKSKTDIPFEIIVINNNSTDRTAEVLQQLGVTNYFQPVQGVGPSRELGQQKARGEYILSADADCLYPNRWIDIMTRVLLKKDNVFVYSRFSYLSDSKHPRWLLFLYEQMRNLLMEVRQLKRPYLNAYGISMGYVRELGLRVGILPKNQRGFDGRLCFDMMKYGNVALVRSPEAKVWTGTRALQREGGFFNAVKTRILLELSRIDEYFKTPKDHDTKNSENSDRYVGVSVEKIKKKIKKIGKKNRAVVKRT